MLSLSWRESHSDGAVTAPTHVGFGTKLIDATLRHELSGRVEREWRAEGLSIYISLPLDHL
jgi:two-component sensor histidine kinase